MNAEQLNGILSRLADSHRSLQTIEKLAGVRSALEAMANNPTDGNLQTQYTTQLTSLNDALQSPAINIFTVREQKLIDDLNLSSLVGDRLRAVVREALSGSAITPRLAFEAMVPVHDGTASALTKIQRVSAGLSELGIERGGPDEGEVELGFYLPKPEDGLTLERIVEEADQFDTLLKLAYEIVEGRPESPEVTYLTSSDYGFLLSIAPRVIRFLLEIVEKGLNIRKKWAEDREAFRRLRELDHDEDAVKVLEDKQRERRESELDQVIRVAIEERSGVDIHRKNEVTMPITKGVKLLLQKHENGSYIDIRVSTVDDASAGDEEPSEELRELKAKVEMLREIEKLSQSIHVLELQKSAPQPSLITSTSET